RSKTALSTVTMVIAAEIGDVDLLYLLRGTVAGFQHHRGWTHSLTPAPLMAALSLALVWVWYRLLRRKVLNRIAPAALDRLASTMGVALQLRLPRRAQPSAA